MRRETPNAMLRALRILRLVRCVDVRLTGAQSRSGSLRGIYHPSNGTQDTGVSATETDRACELASDQSCSNSLCF